MVKEPVYFHVREKAGYYVHVDEIGIRFQMIDDKLYVECCGFKQLWKK